MVQVDTTRGATEALRRITLFKVISESNQTRNRVKWPLLVLINDNAHIYFMIKQLNVFIPITLKHIVPQIFRFELCIHREPEIWNIQYLWFTDIGRNVFGIVEGEVKKNCLTRLTANSYIPFLALRQMPTFPSIQVFDHTI